MKLKTLRIPFYLFIIMVSFVSCTLDENVDPDTGDPRDAVTGSWRFNESPAARNVDASYTVTITNDAGNSSQVMLRNFANAGGNYSAYGIVTSGRITVPSQEMAPGFEVEGSGDIQSLSSMNWEYTIVAGGDMESYTATATK